MIMGHIKGKLEIKWSEKYKMAIAKLQMRERSLIKCMQSYLPFITLLKDQGRAILDIIWFCQSSHTREQKKNVNQFRDSYATMGVLNSVRVWEAHLAMNS